MQVAPAVPRVHCAGETVGVIDARFKDDVGRVVEDGSSHRPIRMSRYDGSNSLMLILM